MKKVPSSPKSKLISSKTSTAPMIAGKSSKMDARGSSQTYGKGGGPSAKADFVPKGKSRYGFQGV